MKIAVVGASGFIGSKILAEASARGHQITALCRHPENIAKLSGVHPVQAEVTDTATLTREFEGKDAIIHSCAPPGDMEARAGVQAAIARGEPMSSYRPADPARHDKHVRGRIDQQTAGTLSIIAAAKSAGVTRILAVGGAGTLLIDGVRCIDLPDFPKGFEGGAKSTAVVKELLKHEPDLEWTVLCPSTSITPGTRTGKFRLGLDDLLVGADGASRISVEDYAMAMIDELEHPHHTRQRFTVGY